MSAGLRRFWVLLSTEMRQLLVERSTFGLTLILPALLILIFGFGLNFDIDKVRVGVVVPQSNAVTQEVLGALTGSKYFAPTTYPNLSRAQAALDAHDIKAILYWPSDALTTPRRSPSLGLVVYGVDGNTALTIRTYVEVALGQKLAARAGAPTAPVVIEARTLFNEAARSAWYLIPGLSIVVITLVGPFVTSIPIARDWERGVMTSLNLTRMTPLEYLLAKLIPYTLLTLTGYFLMTSLAIWVFDVPVRGSFSLIVATSTLYILWAECFGLFLSAKLKVQVLANQLAILFCYLPALMLSGFLFDLRSVPTPIALVGRLMPPTYAIESLKVLFLSGEPTALVWRNLGILALYALLFFVLTWVLLSGPRRQRKEAK